MNGVTFEPSDDALVRIQSEIDEIERENDVRVLFAVESGSRAWGFASADSDYDVRFVYKRHLHDYLRLDSRRETIERTKDPMYDIVGWDVSKFLRLLRASNPSALEWLDCPRYLVSDAIRVHGIEELSRECLSSKKLAFHYLGMARENANEFLRISDGEVRHELPKTKKYVYVVRALLSARYVCDYGDVPPIEFEMLLDEYRGHLSGRGVLASVRRLVDGKRAGLERDAHERVPELDRWVIDEMDDLRGRADGLVGKEPPSWDDVNELFIRIATT